MDIIILKIVACICLAIVAGIMAWRDEADAAVVLLLLGLVMICVPWDKVFEVMLK